MRLAPYSYDWIDNLGRRSPRRLVGLPEPRVGEAFTTAGGQQRGRIVSADAGKHLTGTVLGAFMSYVLVPQEHNTTRLLLKVVMQATRWVAFGLSVGDLIMARRQLLNLKQLAERHQGNCVEVATRPDTVMVRDSKDPEGPTLAVDPDDWRWFVAHLRR